MPFVFVAVVVAAVFAARQWSQTGSRGVVPPRDLRVDARALELPTPPVPDRAFVDLAAAGLLPLEDLRDMVKDSFNVFAAVFPAYVMSRPGDAMVASFASLVQQFAEVLDSCVAAPSPELVRWMLSVVDATPVSLADVPVVWSRWVPCVSYMQVWF